jgi:nucleoside-diphosphate-sugar epimerase
VAENLSSIRELHNELKILILGHTGFIGKSLVKDLTRRKIQPYLFDRHSFQVVVPESREIIDFKSFIKNIEEELLIVNLFAAWGNVQKEQIYSANFSLPNSILDLMLLSEKKFTWIQLSSYYQIYRILYGIDKDYYSECKRLFSEKLIEFEDDKVNFVELYLPHIYGDDDKSSRVIPMLLEANVNSNFHLSKGDQTLPLLNIDDCVSGIIDLLMNYREIKTRSVFYLKDFQQLTLRDIVEIVAREKRLPLKVFFDENLSRDNEFFGEIKAPFPIYNFEPSISFSDYVKSRRI